MSVACPCFHGVLILCSDNELCEDEALPSGIQKICFGSVMEVVGGNHSGCLLCFIQKKKEKIEG